jgi:CheY-like chemotaxis protein
MKPRRPILVVDDDADIRCTIADILGEAGYEVRSAANGREALELIKSRLPAPALILLDLMMPELDGWGFMAALHEIPELPAIPVVIFSAHGDAGSAASSLGVAGFVKKPIRLEDLLAAVERSAA